MTAVSRAMIAELRDTALALRTDPDGLERSQLPRVASLIEVAATELEQRDALGQARVDAQRWYDTGGGRLHRLDPSYIFTGRRRSLCGLAWTDVAELVRTARELPRCQHCSNRP